jgi:uncharacterized protein (DUF2267 family)
VISSGGVSRRLGGLVHPEITPPSNFHQLRDTTPVLIRGIFFEGWVPAKTPAKLRSVDDFLERVTKAFASDPLAEPDVAVAAVFAVLRRQISPGEYRQVAWAMRKPLRDLWM